MSANIPAPTVTAAPAVMLFLMNARRLTPLSFGSLRFSFTVESSGEGNSEDVRFFMFYSFLVVMVSDEATQVRWENPSVPVLLRSWGFGWAGCTRIYYLVRCIEGCHFFVKAV